MRNLNIAETIGVSGGDLCDGGMCVQISTTGIPANHYQTINSNIQSIINDPLCFEKAIMNILNAGAGEYLETYFNNLDSSTHFYFV
ncbi:hypothetical protein CC99x_002240 [Candidatus Berkiella cookevillensis]|uniref:Uncharacterized protein n=1 Tax=Candidatus Berkiella cookevillensis TaxID=437022 RepID=A0A0Q9YKK4_9GAMM|nr:hypothetical protein [Candidatus Berkiella cookevillensis]MCS5707719.1 hypothetical protein [Candidatus Berkiella cookevillensis]